MQATSMKKRSLLAGLALAGALGAALTLTPAAAQEYPNRPIRLVNPFPPGTSTSLMSRLIAERFTAQTGQPVIVDHKPGAGTNLGSEFVAKAAPDGYTILLGTNSLAINPSLYRNMPIDPLRDLAAIMMFTTTPNVLAVHPSVPANNVRELVDYLRKNPGKLNYGSSGNGATNHIGTELFKSLAKVDVVHVPYKGGADALTALLGGQTQIMFSPPSTVGQHGKTGKLRIIGVGSEKRIAGIDAAPVAETLPGFESGVWYALFAPAATPAAILARLNREANTAIADKGVVELLSNGGFIPAGGTAAELRAILERDTKRIGEVVRASGARVD